MLQEVNRESEQTMFVDDFAPKEAQIVLTREEKLANVIGWSDISARCCLLHSEASRFLRVLYVADDMLKGRFYE